MDKSENKELLKAEELLIKPAREGNNEALARLLHSVYPRVFGYILKMTLQKELTADIVQSAMELSIKRFESYREEKSAFVTWVTSIAVHVLMDHYRKCKRETAVFEQMAADTPEHVEEGLEQALIKLSLPMRLPVVMQYMLGYSQKDIAKALKIPLGTVKSRIYNALAFLKKEMGNDEKA